MEKIMKDSKYKRDYGFKINIVDAEDKSSISNMISIENELLLFKESSILKILMADDIDPERKKLDTCHSYEKLYSVGASNPNVARMILQFSDIINLTIDEKLLSDRILQHVWYSNKILLICENSFYSIYKQTMELMPICDKIIEDNKMHSSIPMLPKIENFDDYINSFLSNGKLFLIASFEILNIFFNMPFEDRKKAYFGSHLDWIKNAFGYDDPLYKLILSDINWIKKFSELRNALQHPEKNFEVNVKNFSIEAGNKFSLPSWKYNLTKKGFDEQEKWSDLITDFKVYSYNFLTFFEEILILSIKRKLDESKSILDIFQIKDDDINNKCPKKYFVQIKNKI